MKVILKQDIKGIGKKDEIMRSPTATPATICSRASLPLWQMPAL